jgi:hypothetical protein
VIDKESYDWSSDDYKEEDKGYYSDDYEDYTDED